MKFTDSLRTMARGAALVSLSVAGIAIAQPNNGVTVDANRDTITKTTIVRTNDLDLSSTRGQRELDRRIKVAVNDVCEVWDISPAREHAGFKRCSRSALEAARGQAVQQRSAQGDVGGINVSAG